MATGKHISRVRAKAGRKSAAARWGGKRAYATACLYVYPADAKKVHALAVEHKTLPADIVAALLSERNNEI